MTDSVKVGFRIEGGAKVPKRAHKGDAGMDLVSAESFVLNPFERRAVRTGLSIALPEGFCAKVLPRSGAALNMGLTVVNAPGLIDQGYNGEVKVALVNMDPVNPVSVKKGDRIAQMTVERAVKVEAVEITEMPETERADGGFGSTGTL